MCPIKRLITWVIGATLFFTFFIFPSYADEETYFITTAYYSPLPWQVKYYNGSYAAEIRMNGKGTHGASGKKVFPWMLAGPSHYPFGTKIYFEWYGVAEVADRWWAIVKKWIRWHEYDRLDIWMWYGDAGRERAVSWGTRTIKGKIVSPNTQVSLTFDGTDPEIWYIGKLQVNPENSTYEDIQRLQEILKYDGVYQWEIDGKFESVKEALIDFQLAHDIIPHEDHEAAWWYGDKTISALRKKYSSVAENILKEESDNFSFQEHDDPTSPAHTIILQYQDLQVNPNSSSKDIIRLQELLRELWHYDGPFNGKYSDIEDSIIDMQIQIWVIQTSDDWWAGHFWNKTKEALWIYYEQHDITPIEKLSKDPEPVTLSQEEQDRISTALTLLKDRLEKQAKYTRKSAEMQLENLEKQIENYIPEVTDVLLQAKLKYILEVLLVF